MIGRIVTVHPTEGERYYLRLPLNHIKCATSFDDLKIFNDVKVESFRESARLYGLLDSDNTLEECLQEASIYQMPYTLRRLFATILVYCRPTNPRNLWEKFEVSMSEDYHRSGFNFVNARLKVLEHIHFVVESMGNNINDYHLVDYDIILNEDERCIKEINDELGITVSESDLSLKLSLTSKQKYAYDRILEKVFMQQSASFFIDGPGGTGKTYLYKAILATLRSKGMIALATASSGVAASVLPGGRTAHSRFKIPLAIEKNMACSVSKQSGLAKLLQHAKLIIWDEAPMSHRLAIEALDGMLQDINDSKQLFGGKVVVFGGDFRQVLPVVQKGRKEEIIDATIVKSYLWPLLTKISLTENMRARFDPYFSDFLLRVGDGKEPTTDAEKIKIPASMIIPYKEDNISLKALIDVTFPNLNDYYENIDTMTNRAILTPKNDYVDDINALLIEQFPGDAVTYYSFDETIDKNEQAIQEDFLNSFTPSGFPPHQLVLKENCPIILLRNINPSEGLCNGTRLICRRFSPNLIDAEIVNGHYRRKRVFLPRIPFIPIEGEKSGFPFKRTQFPIRLSFAMTINKAQGQTLDYIGIYLPEPVFSHGQLYVALSRAKTSQSIKMLIRPTYNDLLDYENTKNIVYHDLLNLSRSLSNE